MKRIWPIVIFILAAGLQGNLPPAVSIMGGKPDLILVALISYSLAADPIVGAGLGFVAGLIQGSYIGLGLGSFMVTRTITGFLAGLVNTRLFSENPFVSVISALWLTFVCEGLFLLGNPPDSLGLAMRKLIGECIANGVAILCAYYLIRHLEVSRKIRLANARL